MKDRIVIRGARQHNLKNLDLDIPRRAVVVITGPSGSGKSSLAFDTVYAEGQRRYVESMSTYAKQFLDRMEKPDVDRVDGISPAVAIEQRNPTKTSRSTVGTATEVFDYLRLLWARVGRTYCPGPHPDQPCGREVKPDTVQSATDAILALPAGTRMMVCFPLPLSTRVTHAVVVENLRALGFMRLLVDGGELHLDELPEGLDLVAARELLVVVDRLRADPEDVARVADSLQMAFNEGEGEAVVVPLGLPRLRFTERFRCPDHPEIEFATPSPQLFSFNNPYGSCPECTGFGAVLQYDETLIVPNASRALAEGAVDPWAKPRYEDKRRKLAEFAAKQNVSSDTPWAELPAEFRKAVLRGVRGFQGVFQFLEALEEKRYKQYIRVFLRQYQSSQECPSCGGAKLRPEALRVRVGGRNISEVSALPLGRLRPWLAAMLAGRTDDPECPQPPLTGQERGIAESILLELDSRVGFLVDVGLSYLTLERQTRTLSGGEAQRISLANALGSRLVDTLYVLDEPTIGLHPADNDRLLRLLVRLREQGNTVIVVEHDPEAMRLADFLVEIGPGSGELGGQLMFAGTLDEMLVSDTLTGRYLSGRERIEIPERRRPVDGPRLRLEGAREHNLKGDDAVFPLGAITVVTGVSGSGKSTLVHDVLYRAVERELSGGETTAKRHLGETVGAFKRLHGVSALREVVLVDQSPIGRTPRSNPVTYIKAYDEVRRIFSSLPEAKRLGFGPGHFSFNVAGGRCEACKGEGQVQVEMVFMADVFVPCEVCAGARFRPEVLQVKYRGNSIRDVLEMTVDESIRFFLHEDRLGEVLWHLQQVGLGYLRLGQPAPTLSGGEAQRIKVARELAMGARRGGRKLYILDEPTTGLHMDDIKKLLRVLGDLADAGHTVILIEHNLDVMKTADWIVDLGPGAGPDGGHIVAMGRPEDIVGVPGSLTGEWLAGMLEPVGSA
ncbi:excinuclease ABC subunit UvrA [Longimicrobium terrae]|uniref:UvrABC system protein A n=1 Tax=Longimicrobium terrae TaxID=1639882 RepID=A0A841H277_9BACT|nr:excinuclease ABC subunit UvrA [Longimicrobium terrae]MBB4637685.1 excinuclease ABC subunit A [Longimicrobium terrae]MBB6072082.1 excinuclease ABC subunit A [Longimicrobium terrae]NNC29834.1 excinuclease ABC subunit UvrA [Longimicrobium terrae]